MSLSRTLLRAKSVVANRNLVHLVYLYQKEGYTRPSTLGCRRPTGLRGVFQEFQPTRARSRAAKGQKQNLSLSLSEGVTSDDLGN